jgi:hypothetical protein
MTDPVDRTARLEVLRNLLDAAARLSTELEGDPLFKRFLDVYFDMPPEDRAVVVGAIERDVKARLLSRATEKVTGQVCRPNPNARLYVRAHGPEAQRSDLERDEMMFATIRMMRVMHVIGETPEIHAEWRDATREALRHVDRETRELLRRLLREMLALVDGHDEDGPEPASAGTDDRRTDRSG